MAGAAHGKGAEGVGRFKGRGLGLMWGLSVGCRD